MRNSYPLPLAGRVRVGLPRARTARNFIVVALIAIVVYAADQGSKYWILSIFDLPARGSVEVLPFFNLTMVWNTGITFGLFRAEDWLGRLLLDGLALVIVGMLLNWLRQDPPRIVVIAIGLIAGGAAGNLHDRLSYGAVCDFLHFHAYGYNWYVFNVADASIVCGGIAIALDALFPPRAKATKTS